MEAVAIKLFCPNLMTKSIIKQFIYYNTKWALMQTYIGAHFVKILACVIEKTI
jgi:hypothetical protein